MPGFIIKLHTGNKLKKWNHCLCYVQRTVSQICINISIFSLGIILRSIRFSEKSHTFHPCAQKKCSYKNPVQQSITLNKEQVSASLPLIFCTAPFQGTFSGQEKKILVMTVWLLNYSVWSSSTCFSFLSDCREHTNA